MPKTFLRLLPIAAVLGMAVPASAQITPSQITPAQAGPAQTGPARPDPAALATARQIVDTVLPPEKRSETIANMMRALASQMRGAITMPVGDEGLMQIFDNYIARMLDRVRPATDRFLPRQAEAMAQAYVREFTPDELTQIAAFAKTPAGRHYLSRSAAIVTDPAVAEVNRVYFQETQQETRAGLAELVEAFKAYLTKHPELARKVAQERANAPAQR